VVFDGVYNNSKIWVNSYYMGKRPYGYSTFAYDISHAAGFGDDATQISVRVDHEHTADSRWFTGSGITRKVSIVVKEPLYIDNDGVFFASPDATAASAKVRVRTVVVNETGSDARVAVRNTLADASGAAALALGADCAVPAGQSVTVEQAGIVTNPRLWSPDAPNLYALRTELISLGETLDAEETRVGIRSFRFDADKGFFLNGENMKLKGVCVHHDAGCLGAAAVRKVWERRLKKLKAMGCNAIRMSHNPHMPELYDLCDEMGFMAIDEAFDEWEGPKNKWSVGHNVYPPQLYGYFEDFPEWHEKDLRAMVLRDRNHPGIILWSIGNEIDYPNDPYCHPYFADMTGNNDANKPTSERRYSPDKPNAERIVTLSKRLASLVKQWDDTRPVTAAVAFPELSNITGYCDTLDVCGYNYKEQWYEEDHARYPKRILLGSENSTAYPAWTAVRDHDFISGQFLWTGVDFLGEAHGWPVHGSMAGLLTTAGFEKPQYYFRKSLWSDEPMVQLATARPMPPGTHPWHRRMGDAPSWNYTEGETVTVICYTNCPAVDIRLNGALLGTYRLADFADEGFISCEVPYREGILEAVGTARDGSTVQYALVTAQAAAAMAARPDATVLGADGEDIAQIEVTVVDGRGVPVYNATDRILVEVEGAGALLGIDNGDQADNTEYSSPARAAYRGRLLVYVRAAARPGRIAVKLSASGAIRDAVVELEAR
jgi:beta-galactosidase